MDENNPQDNNEPVSGADLIEDENKQASQIEKPAPPEAQKNAKERLYDKVPLTVKHLNIIIALLIIALVAVLILGTLRGNGVI